MTAGPGLMFPGTGPTSVDVTTGSRSRHTPVNSLADRDGSVTVRVSDIDGRVKKRLVVPISSIQWGTTPVRTWSVALGNSSRIGHPKGGTDERDSASE